MSETASSRRGYGLVFGSSAVLLAFVLYVLSSGPVWWLVYHKADNLEQGLRAYNVAYSPIDLARNHSRTFDNAMGWYIAWWFKAFPQLPQS